MVGRVLVTGASGFVGAALVPALLRRGRYEVRAAVRHGGVAAGDVEQIVVGDLGAATQWQPALHGVGVVIHTAARVHVMRDTAFDPLSAFRAVNVAGTLELARQAAACGVRRFVFISSIKVHGEGSPDGQPLCADHLPAPVDPYGISKLEAESGLRELAAATEMEVVILRPPLVYGPGVKGNFLAMMRWLHAGIPLPLGAIRNLRSLVALDNLVDLIVTCVEHGAAANQIFLVSDGEDLSTTELLERTAAALGRPAWLVPVPAGWLRRGARLFGKEDSWRRLCGSLQVDIGKTRQQLGWEPPVGVDEGLRRAARHFLQTRPI